MAAKTIDMSKLRTVIKFYVQGKSKVFISSYLGLSRNTVKKYIKQFSGLKLTFDELNKLTDVELDELFSIQKEKELNPKRQDLESFSRM
jgi:transposase